MRYLQILATLIAVAVVGLSGGSSEGQETGATQLWAVDPLAKVFRDARPPAEKPAAPEAIAAGNEYESLQLVLRSNGPLTNLRARVADLPEAVVNFVGFVPVRANTRNTPDAELVRKAPAEFPDPLLPPSLEKLDAASSLPIWITIRVPKDKQPGRYKARLLVEADQRRIEHPFVLRVAEVRLPDKRNLWITNWFSAVGRRFQNFHGVADFGEKHWETLEHYAEMMAAHRQNVVLTPIYNLIDFKAGPNGTLAFDFSRFDRWVRLFQEAGVIGLIEGSHLAGRAGWTAEKFDVRIRVVNEGKVASQTAHPDDPKVENFLSQLMPALEKHLAEKGWLDIYLQHLADEPIRQNAESYRVLAALVKKYAPRIRRVDANHYRELAGALDVWVPQLNYYDQSYDFYRQRQKAGEEVWTYTCLAPTGTYPNRLIDYSLLKVRLLHWLNFRFGATGYLHWGWNQWSIKDPFADVEPPHGRGHLPPGDGWIVYPSEEHVLLSSIRFEAMRDGIEDYELLRLLSGQSPQKAQALAERMIPKMSAPERNVARFRQARRELLAALGKL